MKMHAVLAILVIAMLAGCDNSTTTKQQGNDAAQLAPASAAEPQRGGADQGNKETNQANFTEGWDGKGEMVINPKKAAELDEALKASQAERHKDLF